MAFDWLKKKKKSADAVHDDARARDTQSETEDSGSSRQTPDDHMTEARPPAQQPRSTEHPDESTIAEASDPAEKKGLFSRLKAGLSKTRQILTTDLEDLFRGKQHFDDEMLEELEELLITSDIGVSTTADLMTAISKKASRITDAQELKAVIRQEILSLLEAVPPSTAPQSNAKPLVTMVVGVNGVGKTTTIGKLAATGVNRGGSVLIAAADTFRAAAIEQLAIWAERAGADFVHHKANADPAAVAYDGVQAAQARNIDWVLVDTAGRLHTKVNLMEELKKIKRTIAKIIPDAPHEILLVLDATTGQNAISQARLFNESLGGVTGLVLTKLDGTAKGGVVVSICRDLNLPIAYIGVGEAIEDLQPFDARRYVEALF